jgi:hypothetical protein
MSRLFFAAAGACLLLAGLPPSLRAQDLSPRAYLITPLRSNAVTVANVFNDGDLHFEGTVPITGATGRMNMPNVTLYHSLGVFGRSANVAATMAYGVGNFAGTAFGAETEIYSSGLFDSVFRFSVNLKGAPAMSLGDFSKWQQKTLIGASLKVVAPTGQYDPTKLINLGSNRWTFKPELGLSRAWGRAELDAYGCRRTSRVGITSSLPLTRHQSLKLSYAQGAYIRFGGDYKIFSVAWQYSWFDGRATRAAK